MNRRYESKTSQIFFWKISQQIWLLEVSKVLAEMCCGGQAVWNMAKFFFSNLHRHVMNKCWKFQKDILILVWFRAERLKICCNKWPRIGHYLQFCLKVTRSGPFVITNFQWIGHYSDINQDIFLKFSAFVYHISVLNWQQNFCCCSINLPATAHFGQNFGWL